MIGELVALFTGPGTLEEHFRLAAHRITLGGGYAAASFAVIDDNVGCSRFEHGRVWPHFG